MPTTTTTTNAWQQLAAGQVPEIPVSIERQSLVELAIALIAAGAVIIILVKIANRK